MKLETLTKGQEAMIPVIRDQWMNLIFNTRLDREKAKEGIEWLYTYCGKEKPVIIFMDSPLGCQVAANYFIKTLGSAPKGPANIWANIWANIRANIRDNIWANIGANIRDNIWANIGDNIRDNIWANIGDNIRDNIWANIGANIRDNIWANIGANIRDNIWANIGDNIRDNIWANIGDNIRDNIWANIGANIRDNIWANIRANIRDNIWDNKLEYYYVAYRGTPADYGWVAYLDYFLQLKMIHSDKEADFNKWKELLLAGAFDMIQMDGICFVSDMPTSIKRDSDNQLHSLEGMSVQFKDEWGQYYIHGRHVPEHLFKAIQNKELTTEQFFKEGNEEIKSACIVMMHELHGEEFVFRFFQKDLKEVDTYVDKKDEKYLKGTTGGMNVGVYSLFLGRINNEPVSYVRCYCPSSDRMFFLGVEPIYSNAKDAIASLYRVPAKLKKHIQYIQRQGERFSTVFNETGTKMLKENKLTKSDISNTTTISGDQYFSLLKFEY